MKSVFTPNTTDRVKKNWSTFRFMTTVCTLYCGTVGAKLIRI
uniref:Uncharacterized protein n=1 Tax=Anguilla anguilla TaxID=7936 RepID=A0A0E9VDH2_ANGAN